MLFFSQQKRQVKAFKELQKKLIEDHKILEEELKGAHVYQAELQEESIRSNLDLQKVQESYHQLHAETTEAMAALSEERILFSESEAENKSYKLSELSPSTFSMQTTQNLRVQCYKTEVRHAELSNEQKHAELQELTKMAIQLTNEEECTEVSKEGSSERTVERQWEEIEQARNALEVAKRGAEVGLEIVVAHEEQKELAGEIAAARAELDTRRNDLSLDRLQWSYSLEDGKKRYTEAEQHVQVILEDKLSREANLEHLAMSYTESRAQAEQALEELAYVDEYNSTLLFELSEIKDFQQRAKGEEIKCQNEHGKIQAKRAFHKNIKEAHIREYKDLFCGGQNLPDAWDNWKIAQSDMKEQLRKAIAEREEIAGQIAELEPFLQAANERYEVQLQATEEAQQENRAWCEHKNTAALQEEAAADQLKNATIAYEAEEKQLRTQLQLAKAKVLEERQEHLQLLEKWTIAKRAAASRIGLGHCASRERRAAAKQLAGLAPGDLPTAKALLSCLADEDCTGARCAILDALGRHGEVQGSDGLAAATSAVASVGDTGHGVSAEALQALRRLSGRGGAAEVCQAIADRVLHREDFRTADVTVSLLDLLGSVASASENVSLGTVALETAVHVIKNEGPSRERRAGIRIIHRIGRKGDETMVDLLVNNLEDPDEDLRKAAADALCEIGGSRRLLQELSRCLNNKSVTRRDAALQILRRLHVDAEDHVVRQIIGQAIFRGNQAARAGGEVVPAIYSRLKAEEEKRASVASAAAH